MNAVDNFKQSQKYSIARLDTIKKAVYSKYHRLTSRIDSLHQSMVHDVQSKVHISGAFIEDYSFVSVQGERSAFNRTLIKL